MKTISDESGQATVEIALLIPLLAIFLLLIIQVGIVARQHVLVANASRAAARESSVNKDTFSVISTAHKTVPNSQVKISRPDKVGDYLTVTVRDTVESSMPLISIVFPDIAVSSSTTMRVEK